jgi:hypothetical protein
MPLQGRRRESRREWISGKAGDCLTTEITNGGREVEMTLA